MTPSFEFLHDPERLDAALGAFDAGYCIMGKWVLI